MNEVVIDGNKAILGRMASFAAKQALRGNNVIVVNCEGVLVSGRRRNVIENYQEIRAKGGSAMNGPNFPSNPSRIVKRTIRGMLPYKKKRGLDALKRVRCYDSTPVNFDKKITNHYKKEIETATMTLRELSKEL